METSNSSSNSSDWLEIVNTNTDLEQEIESPDILNLQTWKNTFEKYPPQRKERRLNLYFNGGNLDWGVIQSEIIPERDIVKNLLQSLDETEELIRFILLHGETGEGKTTALMQTVYQRLKKQSGWKIYWRQPSSSPNSESLDNLIKYVIQQKINNNIQEDSFLFVSDCAEQIFDDVYKAMREVEKYQQYDKLSYSNFCFLLCCRTTEWEIEKKKYQSKKNKNKLPIYIQNPTEIKLSGLLKEDAREIVKAWVKYSAENNLEILDKESIIEKTTQEFYHYANPSIEIEDKCDKTQLKRPKFDQKVLQYSSQYSSVGTGTFFGAILAVRFDKKNRIMPKGLENHVLDLMNSFNDRTISIYDFKTKSQRKEKGILLKTFAYIAAFEAEGQYILEKAPLAHRLSCTEEELDSIIQQLGEEVPISGVSNLLFTRHPRIAEVAFNLLNKHLWQEFSSSPEINQIYINLLDSTFEVFLDKNYPYQHKVSNIAEWNYFSKYFFYNRKPRNEKLGRDLAELAYQKRPTNIRLITILGQIRGASGDVKASQDLFRQSAQKIKESGKELDDVFYCQWGKTEGNEKGDENKKNKQLDVWLNAVPLFDEMLEKLDDSQKEKRVKNSLKGLCRAFCNFEISSESILTQAGCSALYLRMKLPSTETDKLSRLEDKLKKANFQPSSEQKALELIYEGVKKVWLQAQKQAEDSIEHILNLDALNFDKLGESLGIYTRQPSPGKKNPPSKPVIQSKSPTSQVTQNQVLLGLEKPPVRGETETMQTEHKIFIGSSKEGLTIARSIASNLKDFAYMEVWDDSKVFDSGTTIDGLEKAILTYSFAIFVLTPVDELFSRDSMKKVARDNVIFETGLFMGKLGRDKVFIVCPQNEVYLPSDFSYLIRYQYDDNHGKTNMNAALRDACNKIERVIKEQH